MANFFDDTVDTGASSDNFFSDTLGDAPKAEAKPAAKSPGIMGRLADTGVDLAKGVVSFGESAVGVGDIVSFGAVGKGLEAIGYDPKRTQDFLSGLQSDARQKSDAEVQSAEGFWDTAKALAVNPSALIGNIVQSLPGTIGSGAAAGMLVKKLAGVALAEAGTLGLTGQAATKFVADKVKDSALKIAAAAAAGEGVQTAGSVAEAGRQAGSDWSTYVAPAIAAGLGTTAISVVSGGVGKKLGIGDIESDIAARSAGVKGVGLGVQSFAKRVPAEALKEGILEEMPQSAQEQGFQNLATGKPFEEGIGKAAATGLMAGIGMGGGHAAISGKRGEDQPLEQAQEPITAETQDATPLLLENKPDPFISFPDGSVGKQVDVDNFINSLPEEQRIDARARLLGYGSQPAEQASVADIGVGNPSVGIDDAIAAAATVVNQASEVTDQAKTDQINEAWRAYSENASKQREKEFALIQSQTADQQVEQANAITQAQGFDVAEPTLMQLKMQEAIERRNRAMTPVSQRAGKSELEASQDGSLAAQPADAVSKTPVPLHSGHSIQSAQTQASSQPSQSPISQALTIPEKGTQNDANATPASVQIRDERTVSAQDIAPELRDIQGGSATGTKLDTARQAVTGKAVPSMGTAVSDTNNAVERQPALTPNKSKWIMPEAKAVPIKEKQDIAFSVGKLPNSAEAITVRNGVVHLGEYPAQDFDTGEDVTVSPDATQAQVKDALMKAGSVGKGMRFFGVKESINVKEEKIAELENASTKEIREIATEDKRSYMRNAAADILQTRSDETRQKRSDVMKKVHAKNKRIDTDRDTMAQAIAKLGGISKESASGRLRLAPEELNIRGHGVLRVFSSTGKRMDEIGAQLADLGYVQHDEHGKYDQTDFEDKLAELAGGSDIYTPQGVMMRAQESHDQAMQEVGAESQEEYDAIEADLEQISDEVEQTIDAAFDNVALQKELTNEEIDRLFEPAGSGVSEVGASGAQNESGQGDQAPGFALESEAEAEAKSRLADVEQKTRLAELELKRLDEKEKLDRIQREIDSRQDASAENFQLGQSAEDGLSGQGDIFKSAGKRTPGISSNDVSKSIALMRAKWVGFTKINVVQSVSDIPQEIADRFDADAQTEGFYDPQTQSVYLVADNIATPERAVWVAAHEVVGHGGLRMLRDSSVGEAVKIAGQNKFVKDLASSIRQERKDISVSVATEEALAEMQAAIETGDFRELQNRYGVDVPMSSMNGIKGAIGRVVAKIKRFFSVVARNGSEAVSDADVRKILMAARKAVSTESIDRQRVDQGEVALASKGIDQTETAAFKKWFGDSKVVDVDGNPLVVYHGTDQDFSEFKKGVIDPIGFKDGQGHYFTRQPEYAGDYGAMVMPVYLSMQNPYMAPLGQYEHTYITPERRAELERDGYDGMIFEGNGKQDSEYIIFNEKQIKSATSNNGDFDASNPSILKSTSKIIGDNQRKRTPEQLRAFKNIGRTIEVPTLKERMAELWKDAGKKLAQGIADQFMPIKELSEEAYALMRLSKGAGGAFDTLLRGGQLKLQDGVYNFDETKRGGVVDRLLTPLNGEGDDFLWWIAANRAEQLSKEDREHLFTAEDIAAIKSLDAGVTGFDYKLQHGANAGKITRDRTLIYKDALKTFNEFHKNTLDMAEQSGLIDPEARKIWESEFYVPFYRVDEESGVRGANIKSGVVRQQAFKTLKGGSGKLNSDLLDNTLMNWSHIIDAAAKNRAAKASLEAAAKVGVAAEVDAGTKNAVWFMDKGEKRHYLVSDPYVMIAIQGLEYAGMKGPLMDALSTMKNVLTIGVTASPFFKVRNLIRDSVQAIGTSQMSYNIANNLKEGWELTDPKSDAYFRLLAGGGTIRFGSMLEGSESKRVRALVESGVDDSTILDNESKYKAFYKRTIEPMIDAYQEVGNRGEAVNRASLYNQLIKQGKSHAEASLMARDMMDFSMGGAWTGIRFLSQVVPFMNARIQGLYKLGKSAKADPKRFGAVVGMTALASVALMLAYSDDDDWKKRDDSDRDNFWWFKIGSEAFRIPKPFEVGAIGTIAERGVELFTSDEMTGERFKKRVYSLLADNLSMNPVPQLVKPILDIYANKDSFSGRTIENMGMEKLQSEYRFNANTSMTARAASTAGNTVANSVGLNFASPVQIDHMIRGYFGWLGSFVVGSVDQIARPLTDQPDRATPDYWKVATGGMVSDAKSPSSRYVTQMYDQAKTIEEAYGTWRSLLKEGKTEEAKEFLSDNKETISKYRHVATVKRAEAKLNERVRAIERSNMPSDKKKEILRQLQDQKDMTARRFN